MPNDKETSNAPKILYFYYEPAFFSGFVEPTERQDPVSQEMVPQEPILERPTQELSVLQPCIKIWTKHPAELNYIQNGPSHLTIDLTKTPSNEDITNDQTDQIKVDDHINTKSGFTTMGPHFPHAYSAAGVYLRHEYNQQEWNIPRPADQTAIALRYAPASVSRYHGFYGLHLDTNKHPNLLVVYHPGSASMTHGRAPRKLFAPNGNILPHKPSPFEVSLALTGFDTRDTVFLEQNYALYEAEIDVPKKPSGSGEPVNERLTSETALLTVPQARSGRPRNLHIIGAVASGEIARIAQRLDGEITVAQNENRHNYLQLQEGDTLFDALARYVPQSEGMQFDNLDLIGHSRSRDYILKLGEFVLTSRIVAEQFKMISEAGFLEKLQIKSIRLLGCRTACSPRARRVVETILEYFPDKQVYATRGDLFAVHYDAFGLRAEAEPLLADDDVITTAGPGDVPPGEDYPPDLSKDDDDDDGSPPPSTSPFPFEFVVAALSDPNAAAVAAQSFLHWAAFEESFDKLTRMLRSKMYVRDNALLRADCEVLVATSVDPTTIADFRSFDILLNVAHPRIRVYAADGTAYAFPFKETDPGTIKGELKNIQIDLDSARKLPPDLALSWI